MGVVYLNRARPYHHSSHPSAAQLLCDFGEMVWPIMSLSTRPTHSPRNHLRGKMPGVIVSDQLRLALAGH